MRKVAEFIVDKRYFVLALVVVLTLLSAMMLPKVHIVTNMAEYLPDDSSMKMGMDILQEEFPDLQSGNTVRVMFRALPEEEIPSIMERLEGIVNVTSVDYEADEEEYVSGEYRMFVLHTDYDAGSAETGALESGLKKEFGSYCDMVYCVDNAQLAEIPTWILLTAVALIVAILCIMCSSWVEPILFLITIGLAVGINMGTNAFLSGVSFITHSIAAILQMVLSMDYSVILINRYRQELQTESDPVAAMKFALTAAFSAIAGSSVTTIVGLLALVFMKFKIGADMGIILAKGVLISMLCIFTALPALILIFDKAIRRTAKKTLPIRMDKIAGFSHRCRYGILAVFLVFFVAMYLTKGSTAICYSLLDENPIDEVFPKKTTIVMLYSNSDEAAAAQLAEDLKEEEGVVSVAAFGSTIGKECTPAQLRELMEDMGADLDLDDSMLDLIYYEYFRGNADPTLTLHEFISFLQQDILSADTLADQLPAGSSNQLDMLALFTDVEALNAQLPAEQLSALLGMQPQMLGQLYAMSQTESMSILQLLQLIQTNPMVAKSVAASADPAQMAQLQMIQTLINSALAGTEYTSAEMADFLAALSDGFTPEQLRLVYDLYFSRSESERDHTLTPMQLLEFVSSDLANDPVFAPYLDEDTLALLDDANASLHEGAEKLQGRNYSIMMISSTLPEESAETNAFLTKLTERCEKDFGGKWYLIGNSPMQYEMSFTFHDEMNNITLLTAVAIFLVVAVTFRSVSIPVILVLIIQSSVYATITIIGLQGYSIYYLALLVVQCILMGATIDYAILYTSYYREKRRSLPIREAMVEAYNGSIHTILTSGSIIVIIVGLVGKAFSNPAIRQICQTISKGALCATILVIFILPGVLSCFDRLVCYRIRREESKV